jgi:hypothetical protein
MNAGRFVAGAGPLQAAMFGGSVGELCRNALAAD